MTEKTTYAFLKQVTPFLITAQVGLARRQYRGYFRFNRGPGGYPGVAWALTGSGTDPMLIYFT